MSDLLGVLLFLLLLLVTPVLTWRDFFPLLYRTIPRYQCPLLSCFLSVPPSQVPKWTQPAFYVFRLSVYPIKFLRIGARPACM